MSSDYSHGVVYSPETVQLPTQITIKKLKSLDISYIRFQWTDLTNYVRSRIIPISYFIKMLENPRPSVAIAKVALGLVYLITAPGFSPIGEYLYTPDLSSFRICPYAPGQATVMGWFEEKAPITGPDGGQSVQVDLCPRGILRRVVEEAKSGGIEFLVGFESEFILLKSSKTLEVVSEHSWSATNGTPSGSVEANVLEEIADAIQASGIELQMYHPEAAPGQYEIVTGPLPPLEAADALVHTREIIRNVAAKHSLHATFSPRIFMNSAGSSTHAHVSVHSTKGPKKSPTELSPQEASFLASVLENLPGLTALTLPVPASYKRVADGVWSGGTYVCWGTENRESPIRLTNASSPSSRNFELRFIDATASPYLALAGTLGVGYAGIRDKARLTVNDCPGPRTAAQMSEEEREALGITKRMSLSWEESRKNFEGNQTLHAIFGDNFVEKYLSVNQTLADALALDGDDEKATLTRLVEFY